jgi:hypothetical protein
MLVIAAKIPGAARKTPVYLGPVAEVAASRIYPAAPMRERMMMTIALC